MWLTTFEEEIVMFQITPHAFSMRGDLKHGKLFVCHCRPHLDGVLPKGPYPPCLRMADRALLAGYPRFLLRDWAQNRLYISQWQASIRTAGCYLNIKTFFPSMGISIIKMRWSWDCPTFIMGIYIMVRQHIYIEMAPRLLFCELFCESEWKIARVYCRKFLYFFRSKKLRNGDYRVWRGRNHR